MAGRGGEILKGKLCLTLSLALTLCIPAGCGGTGQASSAPSAARADSSRAGSEAVSEMPTSAVPPASSDEGKSVLSGMTLEQKVGQMFFLCFRQDASGGDILTCTGAVKQTLKEIKPGGIALFGENIRSTEQVRALIRGMEGACKTPPFLGVDQEGGTVQRIGTTKQIPATTIPSMRSVAKTGNVELARSVGKVIGSELTVFGFNLDFAPDCDVLTNPKNTAIGSRSFSSGAETAAEFSVAVAQGIRSEGIIPVCKHFPGQGGASADTHAGGAAVERTLEELQGTELVPFRAQIAAGAELVMVGHMSLPKVTGDDTPASLSPKVIQGILREELGFRGVVITDALNMGAVADRYSSGRAAVLAVEAGVDMLLMPADPQAAYDAVLRAVKSGEISETRIDASAERILALKWKDGLFTPKPFAGESLLGSKEHRGIIAQIG